MKKTLLVILIICIVLSCVLYSCKNGVTDTRNSAGDLFYPENIFEKTDIILPEDMRIYRDSLFKSDGRYNFLCTKYADGIAHYYIYSVDVAGENPKSLEIKPANTGMYISNAGYDNEGRLLVFESEGGFGVKYINRYDSNGTLLSETNLVGVLPDGFSLLNYVTADGGIIYMASDSVIIKLSEEGNVLSRIKTRSANERIEKIQISEGEIYAGIINNDTFEIYCLYAEDGEEVLKNDTAVTMNYTNSFYTGFGYDICYYNNFLLYGYNFGEGESTIINFIDSCIADAVRNIAVTDADNFAYVYCDLNNYNYYAAVLTRVPPENIQPKEIIKIACMYSNIYVLQNIMSFNRASSEYYAQCIYYSGSESMTAEEQILYDMFSGYIPDLIFGGGTYSLENFAEKGVLCDLYSFMEQETEFTKDNLLPCVKTPFETNGKLCRLVTNFKLDTLIGKEKNIGNIESWTLGEMLDYSKALPEGTELFNNLPREMVAMLLLKTGLDSFINYDDYTCSFDCVEFIQFLEYLKLLPAYSGQEKFENYYNDTAILCYPIQLSGLDSYVHIFGHLNFEKLNVIGYPVDSGVGTIIQSQYEYGIVEASQIKEASWGFLKYIMRDEYLIRDEVGLLSFPASKSAMDKYVDNFCRYGYTYDLSNNSLIISGSVEEAKYNETESGTVFSLNKKDFEPFLAAINGITRSVTDIKAAKINEIVSEEMRIYFGGGKTAQETAKVIQSRVSIFLGEIK